MKQLLFLLLFPCLALAQYQGNGNQKITLGEQTTADGLVYRGLAADTTRKPSVDTMAYILLDTNTNIIWQYKKATNNAWTRVGGSISSGLTGVLPVANGGTNTSTLTANKVMVGNGTSGVLTPSTFSFDETTNANKLGIGTETPTATLHLAANSPFFYFDDLSSAGTKKRTYFFAGDVGVNQSLTYGFSNLDGTSAIDVFSINELGGFSIGASAPSARLHIKGANTTSATTALKVDNNNTTNLLTVLDNGNVGIGVTNPTSKVQILSTSAGLPTVGLFLNNSSVTSNTEIRLAFAANTNTNETTNRYSYISALNTSGSNGQALIFASNEAGGSGTEAMRVSSNRNVNIGYGATDNGAYKLQVNSQIFATNSLIATSDIRYKENIQPLDKGLEIISKLKPVKFNFISTTENNFSEFDEIGFIAQDVEGALSTELFAKSVVKKIDEDQEDSPLGLMTEKLIPILTKAIQEQQSLIKALEQRILTLENK